MSKQITDSFIRPAKQIPNDVLITLSVKKLKEELKTMSFISQFNKIQKIGFFLTISSILSIILLHFPFGGYADNTYYEENKFRYKCPRIEDVENEQKLSGKKFTNEEMLKKLEYCYEGRYKTLPFSKWRSNEPIFEWFGSTIHTLSALIFALFIGSLSIVVFKDKANTNNGNL
ncbi:hypothetical protein QZJ86_20860 [Methylomonas montana]|uniref:hypothetical protein n=1 Tax=Methylomonas montana TaxID=3058963 RepID=UPI00265A4E09|nr:hypothetical protein [Methylomonas montana]WKJ90429.1 hypothetical protein QZJ86_20860 [Methylomonas montana]